MSNLLKSMRLQIGIFGKTNVGKSSFLNFLTNEKSSIVSDINGTTTDYVEKTMELIPIGPVTFFDTAGIDDETELGKKRIEKTYSILNRINIAIIIVNYNGINEVEEKLINKLNLLKTPFMIVINKNDEGKISEINLEKIKKITENYTEINTKDKKYIANIKELILKIMPENFYGEEYIVNDIVNENDTVVQVIPIDEASPKGRLILPQVRVLRNILDIGGISLVTKEKELEKTLSSLKNPPKLVITDSQIFAYVNKIVPEDIMLTSYSILFARLKGDLKLFVEGARKIKNLKDGDNVLVLESCTHHTTCGDIGRVKIPNLIKKFTKANIKFDTLNGHNFTEDLEKYSLIIHCGACMTNKKEVLSRIILAKEKNVPITNYGIAIAYCNGILERVVKVFNL